MKFYRFLAEPALRIIEVLEMTIQVKILNTLFVISSPVLNGCEGTVRDLKI